MIRTIISRLVNNECILPGTYVRTTAIDQLVNKFLQLPTRDNQRKQIISLGAGSDTRFFRLISSLSTTAPNTSFSYHEFDFPQVTSNKISAICKYEHNVLSSHLSNPTYTTDSLISSNYTITPLDLRTLKPGTPVPSFIDPTLPTMCISECCLIYLSPTEADDILKWISTSFSSVGLVIYEPIGGDDAFGKVMIQNLAARGIVLKTLKKYSSLTRQKGRLRILGFDRGQSACDVDFIHDCWISDGERERIDRLEMMDEREEWVLLARHYCVAWGWKEDGDGEVFRGWKDFDLQTINE